MLTEGIKDLTELENLGGALAQNVKTSQIRKFFGALKQIQADFEKQKTDILLLEPKLAYAVGRAKGDARTGLEKLYKSIGPLIKNVGEDPKKFKRLVQILEGVVAYHKANGGQE